MDAVLNASLIAAGSNTFANYRHQVGYDRSLRLADLRI